MRGMIGRLPRRALAGAAAVSTAAAGLALLQPGNAAVSVLTAAFLLLTPATAAALLLPGQDLLARVAVGIGTAIVVDTAVAQTMLSTGTWSIPGGVLAVGLISALLLVAGPVAHARPAAPVRSRGPADAA